MKVFLFLKSLEKLFLEELNNKYDMICIKASIPEKICNIDDELKAIYHSKDSICIWIFNKRSDRNKFINETIGMLKNERENHYNRYYNNYKLD